MSPDPDDPLVLFEQPELRHPAIVAAFGGWPDAGEVATGSVRYLIAKLNARRLGQITSDDFYDYSTARPMVAIERGGVHTVRYPSNDFFYWHNPDEERDLIILLANEPQLRWHLYLRTFLGLVRAFNVDTVVTLGGLFDSYPHTLPPRVSGLATSERLRAQLEIMHVSLSNYSGPGSIHTSLLMTCLENGIDSANMWGHAPVYVRSIANPKVCHSLLDRTCRLLGIRLNISDLKSAGEYLDEKLNRLLGQNDELRQYVSRLEEQIQGSPAKPEEDDGDTERIIRDVEEFLRLDHRHDDGPAEP